jgi:hypothetical protein
VRRRKAQDGEISIPGRSRKTLRLPFRSVKPLVNGIVESPVRKRPAASVSANSWAGRSEERPRQISLGRAADPEPARTPRCTKLAPRGLLHP